MLIKEYRIPLPLTVDEYRIAQLYMIQKKSREESEGEGSAVEILKNHPYSDGPDGASGQYTYKVFHIGRHLPGWFRNIAPKTALEVHEESWNAYPYTRTIFSVPFVDKFSIEVETYFEADGGSQDNKFKLNRAELRQREVDVIDMVNDPLTGNDYKKEEDPRHYVSKKNGRGPLAEDWIARPPKGVIMCAYKLIKVEFRYWGLQSKLERFIHDYGLRRVMLRAHKQAWAWQDEWVGLTITDIRKLERETQIILQKKLGRNTLQEEEEEEAGQGEEVGEELTDSNIPRTTMAQQRSSSHDLDTLLPDTPVPPTPSSAASFVSATATPTSTTPTSTTVFASPAKRDSLVGTSSSQCSMDSWGRERRRSSRRLKRNSAGSRRWSNASSTTQQVSELSIKRGDVGGAKSLLVANVAMMSVDSEESVRWGLDQIELSDSDSDLEFFDAKDTVSGDEESLDEEEEDEYADKMLATSLPTAALNEKRGSLLATQNEVSIDYSEDEADHPQFDTSSKQSTPIDFLFLIFHGGSIMDPISDRVGKTLDFSTLQTNMKLITELHFRSAIGRIALRMVPCKNVCHRAFRLLCQVSPVPVTNYESGGEGLLPKTILDAKHAMRGNYAQEEESRAYPYSLPVGTIPLIATECASYQDTLKRVVEAANAVHREFLESEEGQGFNGQVCLIGDCMGSVLGYDILTPSPSAPCSKATPSPPPLTPSPTQQHHSLSSSFGSGALGSKQRKISAASYGGGRSPCRERNLNFSSVLIDKTCPTPPQLRPHRLDLEQKESSLSSLHSDHSSNTSINISLNGPTSGTFNFEVSHFFAFGSPLGLLLASRRAKTNKTALTPPPRPSCQFFYNLFYGVDTVASRLEPLLDQRFATVSPITVPNYRAFPTGVDGGNSLKDTVVKHPYLFMDPRLQLPTGGAMGKKSVSSECISTMEDESSVSSGSAADIKPFSVWWTGSRIDYMLEAPWGTEALELLPTSTFSHIVHSRYWEAKEMLSFILRQVLHNDAVCVAQRRDGKVQIPFIPRESVVKWRRKTTNMRISHMRSNHRAVDVIALEGMSPPAVSAKFQYGPLDMASLCKEEVEMYMLTLDPKPMWEYAGSKITDKHGKSVFDISRLFSSGLYPIKFLVKGDHTTTDCNLFVVPPHVEAVVFSVDGALASNFSLSAKDMKLKQGSVEVARMWQELGYLIIYLTGRPDLQKDYILNFLGCHGFPLGLVTCTEYSQSVKTACLARLVKQAKIIIHTGYGSSRHLAVYRELGLQSDQIYIHGRKSKARRPSYDCQYLTDGFASHHSDMLMDPPRKAMQDTREWFGEACFALPGHFPNSSPKKSRGTRRANFKSQQPTSKKGKHFATSPQTDV